ncbi:MAG: ATP-binding cassette domain-containing protein [Clostridiaceae bacterium]
MSLYIDIKKKIKNFNLDVKFEAGNEVFGVLGSSGCGKSMTLKCIAGIETPDCGKIILDGRTLFDSENKINLIPQKRKIGFLFQNYALFPNMTVEENIAVSLKKRNDKNIIKDKIKAFYLEGLEKKYPCQLSGGQQQRVALARILVTNPDIILLDEPFSALDSFLKWQLEQEIIETVESFGKTVLFVSHNRDEVYHICNKIGVIENGYMEETRDKKSLFADPKTLSAALLTGCKNISKVRRLSDNNIEAIDWGVSFKMTREIPENTAYVGIRANDIEIIPGSDDNGILIRCNVCRIIESLFSNIFVLEINGKESIKNSGKLRLEIKKKDSYDYINKKNIKIRIKEEDLLLLT